jgi:hypothetical protein
VAELSSTWGVPRARLLPVPGRRDGSSGAAIPAPRPPPAPPSARPLAAARLRRTVARWWRRLPGCVGAARSVAVGRGRKERCGAERDTKEPWGLFCKRDQDSHVSPAGDFGVLRKNVAASSEYLTCHSD